MTSIESTFIVLSEMLLPFFPVNFYTDLLKQYTCSHVGTHNNNSVSFLKIIIYFINKFFAHKTYSHECDDFIIHYYNFLIKKHLKIACILISDTLNINKDKSYIHKNQSGLELECR